jgi:hypothetical protein
MFGLDLYILGSNRVPVPASDRASFARAYEADRTVARSYLRGGVYVSTVFLAVDRGSGEGAPLLFETLAFDGRGTVVDCDLCSTWGEAERMHARVMARQRARLTADRRWRILGLFGLGAVLAKAPRL